MGPLLALVVIGLILIGLVGTIFGGLNLVFQTIFNYFPYFVVLVILGYLVTKFGGRRGGRMSEAEAGALGAVGGAAASEIADRLGADGGDGPSTTPTSPPSSPPSTSGDDSSSSDSGDVDVTVGGDNLSQAQQQQMQQLQELVLALLEGNLGQGGGGNFVAYGPQQQQQQMLGGLSPGVYSMFMQQISMMQVNQQMLMQQMMQFFMESQYTEINNQFILQFMKQVLDIDIDEGDVSEGDVLVQIQQIIQQIDVDLIYQNIQQIIQEINITDETYIEQLMAIIVSLDEGDFEREGDVIIIYAHQEIRIKAATLITFLNILQVIKYDDLEAMIIALVDMSADISWEVKIEQLIFIYRDGSNDGGKKLTGDNWDIWVKVFRQSNIQPEIKSILLDLFEGDWHQYPINPMWVVNLWRHVDSMANRDVQDAAQEAVNYITENNVRNVNEETFSALSQLLRRNWTLDDKFLKPSNNNNDTMPVDVQQIISNVESIANQIQQDEQMAQEMIQLEEEALNDMKEALQKLGTDHELFQAIEYADQMGLEEAMENGNAAQVGSILNQVEEKIGGGIRLDDPQTLEQVINDLKQVHADLTEAHEDLKQADIDASQIAQLDEDLEETLEQVDTHFVQEKEQELERIEQIFLGK